MAKKYNEEELWSLLRFAVGKEHDGLVDAPMALIVRERFGSPEVVGLVIAEGDEEIEALAENFEHAAPGNIEPLQDGAIQNEDERRHAVLN